MAEQIIQFKLSDLRRVVREELRGLAKEKAELITRAEWMQRTGKGRGSLDYAIRNNPSIKGNNRSINWTEYSLLYPTKQTA